MGMIPDLKKKNKKNINGFLKSGMVLLMRVLCGIHEIMAIFCFFVFLRVYSERKLTLAEDDFNFVLKKEILKHIMHKRIRFCSVCLLSVYFAFKYIF